MSNIISILDSAISSLSQEPTPTTTNTANSTTKQQDNETESKQPISNEKYKKKKLTKQERIQLRKARQDKETQTFQEKLKCAPNMKEDSSLPPATPIKIKDALNYTNKRIEVCGWLKCKLRKPNSKILFINLIDDIKYTSLQCTLTADLCQTKQAMLLTNFSILKIRGVMTSYIQLYDGLQQKYELKIDYFEFCDPTYFMTKELSETLTWELRCKYLIYGYIRFDKKLFNPIPNEMTQVIMLFLGDIWNDYWDLKTKNKHIEVNGNKIKTVAAYGTMSENTIFGTKVIRGFPHCESYKWRIQMIFSNEYGNRHCFFGIIPETNVSDKMYDWFVSSTYGGYGYCHRNGFKYHNNWCDFGYSADMKYGCSLKALDIIEIHLDLKKRTLSYCVNGNDFGVAWDDIPKNVNYRLAVTMGWFGEEIKLLKSI